VERILSENMHKTIIIIPCYNEAERLPVNDFKDFAAGNNDISFLFVNDGSTDNTADLLEKLESSNKRIYVLNLPANSGKGEAVRQGVMEAVKHKPEYIGFLDADLATPLEEIHNFIDLLEKNDFELISGLRLARLGAQVKRKLSRHYIGRVFATAVSNLLRVEVYDTQCGAKLFERQLAEKVFQEPFKSKWLFDIEIFKRIIELYGREKSNRVIYEYPLLTWIDIKGSKLKLSDFIKAPFELLKIFYLK
jgi:glycosyltransferase involved in cell wall biosynthesis